MTAEATPAHTSPRFSTAVSPSSDGLRSTDLVRRRHVVRAQARLDDVEADQRADDRDHERADLHEEQVDRGVHLVARRVEAGGLLGDAGEQRIHRADEQVRAVAARDAGEGGGEAASGCRPSAW